jgi:hypothetical protein
MTMFQLTLWLLKAGLSILALGGAALAAVALLGAIFAPPSPYQQELEEECMQEAAAKAAIATRPLHER